MVLFQVSHPLFVEGDPGWMVGRAIGIGHCDSPDLDNLRQHVNDVINATGHAASPGHEARTD
jgi:hypothetical protein